MVGSWGVAGGSSRASKDLAQGLCLVICQEAEFIEQRHTLVISDVLGGVLGKAHLHECKLELVGDGDIRQQRQRENGINSSIGVGVGSATLGGKGIGIGGICSTNRIHLYVGIGQSIGIGIGGHGHWLGQ